MSRLQAYSILTAIIARGERNTQQIAAHAGVSAVDFDAIAKCRTADNYVNVKVFNKLCQAKKWN